MAPPTTDRAAFAKKDRVIATRPLPGVPEGTEGRVAISNGFTWARYWVQFSNGVWLGSVDGGALVRSDGWDELKRQRAEDAARPPSEPVTVAAVAATSDGADGPPAAPSAAASKVPAHLLERAAAARARKAAAVEGE